MKGSLNIIMIDDDPIALLIGKLVVGQSGISCTLQDYTSALKALQMITEKNGSRPDIIFVDINMPEMNGWKFVRSLNTVLDESKSAKNYRPFISMLSSSNHPDDIDRFLESSVDLFLTKPLTSEKLQVALDFQSRGMAKCVRSTNRIITA